MNISVFVIIHRPRILAVNLYADQTVEFIIFKAFAIYRAIKPCPVCQISECIVRVCQVLINLSVFLCNDSAQIIRQFVVHSLRRKAISNLIVGDATRGIGGIRPPKHGLVGQINHAAVIAGI